ncbi:MAG: SHOCT domain-containing protein [Actinomycetia bacterium]|nr:SHOCT domain-containing protein [Actinomycetes bacterium]
MGIMRKAATAAAVSGAATRAHNRNSKPTAPAPAAPAPAAPAPAASGPTLEDLAAMHASGVLTDEEFTAAKKKALGL